MSRPAGVTALAVLSIVAGALTIILGAIFLLGSAMLAQRMASLPAFLAGLVGVGGFVLLLFGALDLAVAFGLLALANWARILTMIGAAFGLVGSGLRLLGSLAFVRLFMVPRHAVACAIYGLILWYLSQPDVKRAFGAAPSTPGQAKP